MTARDGGFPPSPYTHRPRPAVIQAPGPPSALQCKLTGHPSVQSTSTASDSSMPTTPPLSNPNTGESWFRISAADYPSLSYLPPLPKGARPPSPQPFILASELAHPQARSRNKRRGAPPLHRRSSSWKLEWRGLSKIVRWAFLGDRHEEPVKPRERRRSNERTHDRRGRERHSSPAHQRYYHREHVQHAATQVPLSPSTSETCVDNGTQFLSKSELGHESEAGHKSASHYHGAYPPSHINSMHDFEQRRQTSYLTLKYGNYSYPPPESNLHASASTDYDHQDEMVHCGTDNTHVDVDDSVISHDSTPHWRSSARDVQSDIGHSGYRLGFVSSISLNNTQRRTQVESASRIPFSSFRSAKSNISLSAPLSNVENQRPRRLRKKSSSHRPPLPKIYTDDRLREIPPASSSPASRMSYSTTPSMTAPLSSTKSVTRRKLVKKRSSMNTSGLLLVSPDIPPELPPKDPPFTSDATTEASTALQPVDSCSPNTGDTNMIDVLPHKRPSILRTESNRRWTVAVADVPDDFFVEELERLRKIGRLSAVDMHGIRKVRTEQVHTVEIDTNGNMDTRVEMIERTEKEERHSMVIHSWSPEEESEWLHARRAILCCRELVRTERSYQARLQELYNGNISDTIPDVLLQYIPALIYASNFLSAQFNEDMSASGVSEAFLKAESLLSPAFIAWSSVIGTFFGFESTLTTSRNHKRKLTGSSMVTEEDKQLVTSSGTVRLRRFSARSRHESFTSYPSTPIKATSPTNNGAGTTGLPQNSSRQSSMISDERESVVGGKKSTRKREARSQDKKRFPAFRELAILPTQRVTRYVLLYKDLLKHTQTSSQARLVVEKAVGVAISLAQKCDEVQDKAHIVPP